MVRSRGATVVVTPAANFGLVREGAPAAVFEPLAKACLMNRERLVRMTATLSLDDNTKVDGFGSGAIRLGLGIGYGNTTSTGSVTDAHGLRRAIRLIPATVRPRRHQSAPFEKTHGNTEAKNPFLKTAL